MMFADIIEVDTSRPQIYIYLMITGKGTTTFEMYDERDPSFLEGLVFW